MHAVQRRNNIIKGKSDFLLIAIYETYFYIKIIPKQNNS